MSAASLPNITSATIAAAEDSRPRESGTDVISVTLISEGKASCF